MTSLAVFFHAKTRPELTSIAKAAGTKYNNLQQICLYDGACSAKLALRLETATGGALTKEMLRPDIFGRKPKSKAA